MLALAKSDPSNDDDSLFVADVIVAFGNDCVEGDVLASVTVPPPTMPSPNATKSPTSCAVEDGLSPLVAGWLTS